MQKSVVWGKLLINCSIIFVKLKEIIYLLTALPNFAIAVMINQLFLAEAQRNRKGRLSQPLTTGEAEISAINLFACSERQRSYNIFGHQLVNMYIISKLKQPNSPIHNSQLPN